MFSKDFSPPLPPREDDTSKPPSSMAAFTHREDENCNDTSKPPPLTAAFTHTFVDGEERTPFFATIVGRLERYLPSATTF